VIVIADRPQKAVHAGGDNRQPPLRSFFINEYFGFKVNSDGMKRE